MPDPKVHSNEGYREDNAEAIAEWFEKRVTDLADTLEGSNVDFDYEKVDGEPEEQVKAYTANATKGLAAILAKAAADEAAAKAGV